MRGCIGNQASHMIWEHSVQLLVQGFGVGGWLCLSLSLSCLLSLSPSEASPLTAVPANLSEHLWLLW